MKTGFLSGGGAAGALMRSHPWQQSRLGAVETWPDALRTVVTLMLNSQFPMFLLWGKQRVCLYNDGYIPILGRRHPAALAQPMHEVWPEIWNEISPLIDRAYAGLPTFFENLPLQIERNGFQEQACFTFSYSPLRGPWGDIEGMFCTCMETTVQLRAESALRRSEAQFRGLAQAMPNQAWTARPDGSLDWFNDRVYDYAGVAAGDPDGIRRARIVHPEDIAAAAAAWACSVATGCPFQTEFRLRRLDGVHRWHIARAVPILAEDGSVERWIGTNTDIEERKRAADLLEIAMAERSGELEKAHEALRQAQKMEAVGQLTGGIAHDFNNLLTGVIGGIEMMQARLAQGRSVEAERCAGLAMHSAQRAAALTHRLLAFSRRQPLEPRAVSIHAQIDSMAEMLRRTIGPAIRLKVHASADLWATRCDPNQLENALLNLVINARDAMADSGLLTISTANCPLDAGAPMHAQAGVGDYVRLTVSDTGVGMTPETISRVFEPFFTTKPIGHGTGLGLSMVYGFARQSGGMVQIDSRLGAGTDVHLYLPRLHGDRATELSPASRPARSAATVPKTILVVDDEPPVRELIMALLQDLGHHCIEAHDGPGGLQLVSSLALVIDLLITDVGLPGLGGRQLAAQARALRPQLKVLFITGYATEAIFDVDAMPGTELLNKPFSMAELAARVAHLTHDD